jgi:hypothetical protein
MKSKMKSKITYAMLLITLFLCGLAYYNNQKTQPFRCDSQLVSHIELDGSKVDLNLNTIMILTLHGESVITFNGSITRDTHEYRVSRSIFFRTAKSELNGINQTKITREQIGELDTLTPGLWQQYILQGTEFYVQMKNVNNKGFLLQDLSNPYFVCAFVNN